MPTKSGSALRRSLLPEAPCGAPPIPVANLHQPKVLGRRNIEEPATKPGSRCRQRGLTPRSTREPTAGRAIAPFHSRWRAASRRLQVTSNVRPRNGNVGAVAAPEREVPVRVLRQARRPNTVHASRRAPPDTRHAANSAPKFREARDLQAVGAGALRDAHQPPPCLAWRSPPRLGLQTRCLSCAKNLFSGTVAA